MIGTRSKFTALLHSGARRRDSAQRASAGDDGRGVGMRIAMLSYRSKPHVGGQGIYVRRLSRELVALGHAVEVFSGQPYPDLDEGVVLTKVPSLDLYRPGDEFRNP